MRVLIRMLLAVMILAIVTGVLLSHLQGRREDAKRVLTRQEVVRLQQQIYLQAALISSEEEQTAPAVVDPAWFPDTLPTNPLLGPDRPWLEVAAEHQFGWQHPPNLTAEDPTVASFWYNPSNGVVRARVPVGISDAQALALYNEVNDCTLSNLFPTR